MQLSNLNIGILKATRPDAGFSHSLPVQALDHARHVALPLLRAFADRPSYILGVTSALPGEGKTVLSQGLAEVMATDFGLKVVLLDTHAEQSWQRIDDRATIGWGLVDWLSGECSMFDALIHVHDKYSVLPMGSQAISSRDLLQYLVKVEALQQLREHWNLIMLDLPHLNNPAGAALANLCDGIVVVIRSGETPVDAVKEFLPVLQNVTIHGAVLNRHRSAVPGLLRRIFS